MTTLLARLFSSCDKDLPEALRQYRAVAGPVDPKQSIQDTEFVAFDTELTGLDYRADSIVSIGAIKIKGGRVLPGHTFYRLVKPESELKGSGVVVHGLTHTDLASADALPDALEEFATFIGGSVLVGHFVNIDVNFVNRAMKKHFGVNLRNPAVDTRCIHDWLYDNDRDFKRHHNGMTSKSDLFSMAKRYGVSVQKTHNAFYDAYLTAQLFQRFIHFLSGCGVSRMSELLAVGKF